ncbi:MAG: hypothetical protein K2G03_07045 [Bacilli bacterium]|nr:hypothetical protein [Bacilli bacterium]
MYFILRKDKKNKRLALIPIINIYQYLKICELPFWVVLIPLCNVVMLILSPIKLAKMYRCNKLETVLGIFFPFLFINYIAFSDMTNKRINEKKMYLPNQQSVDNLDRKLIDLSNGIIEPEEKEYIYFKKKKNNDVEFLSSSMTEEFIDNIEKKSIYNDINEDATKYEEIVEQIEVLENDQKNTKSTIENNEIIETLDDARIDMTIKSLDNLSVLEERNIEKEKNDDGIDKNEYKDFEGVKASNEAIAFGGEKRKEKVYSVQAKKDELKCSRCGSSLVGSNGFCPGCGAKI